MRHLGIFLIILLLVALAGSIEALDWPIFRDSAFKPIGNSYAGYQEPDFGTPFLHTGIDILAPPGVPVFAVTSGYIKAILTTYEELHWRVVIGDSAGTALCDAWMYAHLDYESIVSYAGLHVGDSVEEGQYIGNVVQWTINDFNHIHFSKIRYGGDPARWKDYWIDWIFIGNPLAEFDDTADPDPPVFENAVGDSRFALSRNQSSTYFTSGETVSGDVDIVCRVYDYVNTHVYKTVPYSVEYNIDQGRAGPWAPGICFTGAIGSYAVLTPLTPVVYRNDDICDSRGLYGIEQSYLNVTNGDGDSLIELSDALCSWHTADFANGEHTIYVRARDRAGNETIDSMTVAVANYFSLSGKILLSDQIPQPLAGTIVTIVATGQLDTTDTAGSFAFSGVGGGSQIIRALRAGFVTADTIMIMNQNRVLETSLAPGGYVAGDANSDGTTNVGDVVFIINFVFKGGMPPFPYAAGDANWDDIANVADAVYLVSYIFRGGPPPQG